MKYERIRNLREDRDLTQTEIAEILIALAHYHNTSIDYLLGLTDERTPYPRAKNRDF